MRSELLCAGSYAGTVNCTNDSSLEKDRGLRKNPSGINSSRMQLDHVRL